MEVSNCPNPKCGAPLPGIGIICPKCRTQYKCANKECGEILILGEDLCVHCGQEVLKIKKKEDTSMNTIKYSRTIDGKKSTEKFETRFTDVTSGNVGAAFGHFLGNRLANKNGKTIINAPTDNQEQTQDVEFQEESSDAPKEPQKAIEAPKPAPDSELVRLTEMFRFDGEIYTLKDTELKAKTKQDFYIRLTCVFLYMKNLEGVEKVSRVLITTLMSKASLLDGNFRRWIAGEENLLHGTAEEVEIRLPGIKLAQKVLAEKLDPNVPDGWVVGTIQKRKPRGTVKS